MARRYVRDKIGRFAAKGGGGKRSGKLSKSTAGRSAKAKYKSATSNLRKVKAGIGSTAPVKGQTYGSKGHKKKIATAKGRVTRVTNKLTAKRAAATPTKKAATKKRVTKKAAVAKKAKTATKKKALAKSKSYSGLTPKQQYKSARSKARAAKSGYAQDRGQGYDRAGKAAGKGKVKRSMKLPGTDSARSVGSAKAQVTKLQKKFRKGVTQGKGYGLSKKGQKAKGAFRDLKRQRGGVTKGKGTIAQRKKSLNFRTTQQAFGMKVKKPVSKAAQKYIGKQNVEASRVAASRGKGSKAKRRAGRIKRASSRYEATRDTRNIAGSKMVRRPSRKTTKGNLRAEQALDIYTGKATKTSIKNFGKGRARTERARKNWRPSRSR